MKTVLFCGGQGTRISGSFSSIPKPLIPVGPKPVLLHLMDYYMRYGHSDFVLCLGYKAHLIKEFFLNYHEWMFSDCVVRGTGGCRSSGRAQGQMGCHSYRHGSTR